MLTFIQKMARKNPEIVYGDGSEGTRDSSEARLFCRKVAADGMVLLKNEGNLLPFTAQKVRKLAVIGPNAQGRVISGGGSAALKASYVVTPWEGILENAPPGIDITYEVGCYGEHRRK
jgi:beta-glucosidase